ncbi:unnamed protein product [Polarella glacialis]|uniref:Uncharacterized protein n=1 Tax=Polarella glacialis TaxID=89957 RepID=A0A813ERL7_POLGL|nr:unnamed protein product [Polarella glacialis]
MDGAASDPCDKCFGIGFDRARLVMSGWLRGFSANSFLQTERGQPVLFAALDLFALRQPVLFAAHLCLPSPNVPAGHRCTWSAELQPMSFSRVHYFPIVNSTNNNRNSTKR